MAQMHPRDIEVLPDATEGEKKVFRFLKEIARPDDAFTCWYEPQIKGQRADFILYSKDYGLLVLEVKDWAARQIKHADPHYFTIFSGGEKLPRTNPEKQAKRYADLLMQSLRGISVLRARGMDHRGKPKIPISRAVVFTNISKEEYTRWNLHHIIPLGNVLLKDDLDPCGEILRDPSGGKFRKRIEPIFPFRFKGLTDIEFYKMKYAIQPEVDIDLPVRDGAGKTRFQTEVVRLDEQQARLAINLKRGHWIIKGPPGSGKTLVLAHRCCHLKKDDQAVKRILFVCYNIVLVSYIKRLIQENGVGVGDGVKVCHFFDLCSQIVDEKIHYEKEGHDYYRAWIELALESVGNGQCHLEPFDAIFIDEAQDFNDDMIRVVLGLLKPKGDLVIALDAYQEIYRRKTSWKELGIHASGRSRYLRTVYRNTREIFEFTQRFIGENPGGKSQEARFPFESAMHGPKPELRKCSDYGKLENFVIDDISKQIEQGEFKRSEIAIIYDDKAYGPQGFQYDPSHAPGELVAELEAAGIPSKWVSRDVRSKELFDITTDRVSVVSVHSAKGIDYDMVYLLGLDALSPTEVTRDQLIRLAYVAMTRAKYRLVIPYVRENDLIGRMKECLKAR
jgi:hypothetical protein